MDCKKLLGKRIKEIRKMNNLTQDQLAEKINIDITTLSGIEIGRNYPSIQTLEKLADALSVELYNLFKFNHLKDIQQMKIDIKRHINIVKDDDIRFIHRFIDEKYLDLA